MANQQRGLPSGFGIKVPATATQRPVDIGDYLDDDSPAVAPPVVTPKRTPPPAATVPSQPVLRETPPPRQNKARETVVASRQEEAENDSESASAPQPGATRKSPPRKQINMRPETIKKAEDLIRFVQTYSVQKDTKASEVFDAIVELLHDAKSKIDLSQVTPRGQWGKSTAKAFRTSLKNAFGQAIVELQQAKNEQ